MITFLDGTIRELSDEPPRVVLLVNGIGYEVLLPVFVHSQIVASGAAPDSQLSLEIYYHATERQPKPMLVGFCDAQQRSFFEQVLGVKGIGPSLAVSALIHPPDVIANAIESDDTHTLSQLPGIGRRSAEQMVATLRGKVQYSAALANEPWARSVNAQTKAQNEAIEALTVLKLNVTTARQLVNKVVQMNPQIADKTEDIIREVFREQQG